MSWNDLSMADRAKYIRLGVQNRVTDLDSIREVYNIYAGGGLLTNEQLLEKVHKLGHEAYIKKGQLVTASGAPLVYNYSNGRFELANSQGNAFWLDNDGKFVRYNIESGNQEVINKNDRLKKHLEHPSLYQAILEDEAFVKNRNLTDIRKDIPFVDSKREYIKKGISKNVPISSNFVDSIVANLPNRSDQLDALGISSRETNIGYYPAYTTKGPGEDWDQSFFEAIKEVTPTRVMNNHTYYISPVRGELNTLFPEVVKDKPALVYGHPGYYYTPDIIDTIDEGLLERAEKDIKYQKSVGKFNPIKKLLTRNKKGSVIEYYNPEDNPWINAVQNLHDRDYGMGKLYTEQVREDAGDLQYLLNKLKL